MKVHRKTIRKVMVKRILSLIVFVCLQVLPSILFGQNPGDNPDAVPQAVPLDPKMSLLLIAVGVFLAAKVMQRKMNDFPVTVVMPRS